MAAQNAAVRSTAAKRNALSRYRSPHDPVMVDAERELRAARLEDFVSKTVAGWPKLSPEQLDRIAVLLRGGGR